MSDPQPIQTIASQDPGLEGLIRRFKDAEAALESLFEGQVDVILDPITALPILLKETQTHLLASEARFRRLLSRNAMVVFELDADGTTLFANEMVFDVFGYTFQELQGQNWWDVLLPGALHDQLDALYHQFEKGDVTQYDLTMTTKQGSLSIIELNSANRRKQDGTLERILGLGMEVTERRKAENELNENHARLEQLDAERIVELGNTNRSLQRLADLREQLFGIEQAARVEAERADKRKLQFLAMVVHELRTPLTPIKGFTSMLLASEESVDAETQHSIFTIIDEEVDKLANLITELTDVGRLQAGTLRVQLQPCRLTEIVNSVMAQLESVAAKHRLMIDLATDLVPISADPQRIAAVLVNLVGNAARYSPAGTQIILSAVRQETSIQVDVSDEGSGIEVENREKVFDAFWQAAEPTSEHLKGSGLGLAICKAIITAHGGNIWVAEVSSGTKISFTLPVLSSIQEF